MKIFHTFLPLIIFFVGCTPSPSEKIEMANKIMRTHVASDVVINIEPSSEKIFEFNRNKIYVCGRASVRQSKDSKEELIQRFIISVNNSLSDGLGRFEANNDTDFQKLWSDNCPAYNISLINGQTHTATMQEWKQAFESVYSEGNVKDTQDGSIDFTARFPADEKHKVTAFAFGRKTLEQSVWLFQGLESEGQYTTGLYSGVFAQRGKLPDIVLKPFYLGSGLGLALYKISVIADGDVLYEHEVQARIVRRDDYKLNVMERADDVLSAPDVAALRKAIEATQVYVVLRGRKDSEKLTTSQTQTFKSELKASLVIYDAFNEALRNHLPPTKKLN